MAADRFVPSLAAAAACCFLLAAVSLNDFSKEIDLEAAANSAGLVQSGKGLALSSIGKWDVSASKGDARLADQIAGWTKQSAQDPPHAARTEELANTVVAPSKSLKQKMHTEADSLRLSDFLSGVNPETTQQQVEGLYAKMDPKDATGWKERYAAMDPKPTKKAQVKEISHFQTILQNQLSTTPNLDSPHAQKMRSELKELLKKRAELKAKIEKREAAEAHGANFVRRKAADEDDDVLKSLSRTEDSQATYENWLRDASGGLKTRKAQKHSAHQQPVITAGGQLKWKQPSSSALDARTHAQLQAAQARLQTLSERAKKLRTSTGTGTEAAKHRAGPRNVDLVSDASGGRAGDSWEGIQQRAAYKVNRWMGGGYVKVYDLGSGR